ncbi:MAG: hypothetical protein EON48_06935 [Acetobacteraceae bacterium]|nr:MAG: hypothetical protein EON48_06935 [Acetobacteraceae bacterium]
MIRGSISLVIVGAILLGGLAVVVKGPQALTRYLPDRMAAVIDRGIGGLGSGKGAAQTAEDYLDDGADGLVARGEIAALAGNRPVFVKDVLSGYTTRVENDIPAEITMIRPISGCRLTPPLDGTSVGHVTAGTTGLALPLLTYGDADLAAAVQAMVDSYRAGTFASVEPPADIAFDTYDVAVTETGSPVYLVLESGPGNRIWNIHLSPGAQIERVVLLGGTHVGVANLDPVVPVEVLPGPAMGDCGIDPAYPLNPGNRIVQALKSGTASEKAEAEAQIAAQQDRTAAYNTWFRDSFGVAADETRAGLEGSSIAVVGQQPGEAEPKAVYAPIQGSRIRMTQDSYFEIQGQVAEGEGFAGRVMAIATSFASGDLTTLRQGVAF